MKKKTRNTIGKILIWGGMGILTYEQYFVYNLIKDTFNYNGLNMYIFGSVAIIALLIGGLWGMKK